MLTDFEIESPDVVVDEKYITSNYDYRTSAAEKDASGKFRIYSCSERYWLRTERKLPKVGLLLVGLGGNNGTTVAGGLLANKLKMKWNTREGVKGANFYGSLTQCGTLKIADSLGKELFAPIKKLVPLVDPCEMVVHGWDISKMNLAEAMARAQVLDYDLQHQLTPHMSKIVPMAGIYYPNFIASNQNDRADNVISGTKSEQLERLRADIRSFKASNKLDKVIILWTANTERLGKIAAGLNETADELLKSVEKNTEEISASTMYGLAAVLEGCPYINGSPQNTFVPGLVELAEKRGVHIAGDDFKTGQTKLKSCLADFLIGSGIKPLSIASYNHLGNNDGKNLSEAHTFRSKEISKTDVVNDMVESNGLLYAPGEKPDHCVVIKYVPAVGDSKRAMDEYYSDIFLHGKSVLAIHNTCEDSLLAAPIILDLVILMELATRVSAKRGGPVLSTKNTSTPPSPVSAATGDKSPKVAAPSSPSSKGPAADTEFKPMKSIVTILGFMAKAPLVPKGSPVVNSLFRQRCCIENFMRALVGLPPDSNMLLQHKFQ